MTSTADIATALAAVSDGDLRALRASLPGEATVAPGLIGWLESAAAWETARRAGQRSVLPDPCCSCDEGESDCARIALAILHAAFDGDTGIEKLLEVAGDVVCPPNNGPLGAAL